MSEGKSYDVSNRLKAVEYAEKTSKEVVAREMGVHAKRNQEWCTMLSFSTEPSVHKPSLAAMMLPR